MQHPITLSVASNMKAPEPSVSGASGRTTLRKFFSLTPETSLELPANYTGQSDDPSAKQRQRARFRYRRLINPTSRMVITV